MRVPDTQALGIVALVVLGAWCVVNALVSLAFIVPILLSSDGPSGPEQYLPLVVYAIAGWALLRFRERIASSFFPASTSATIERAAFEELQSLLIALLGLWFIVEALSAFSQVEVSLNTSFSRLSAESVFGGDRLTYLLSGDAWQRRLPYLIRLAAGLVLFFNSGSVVDVWRRARRAGHSNSELAG